MIASIGHLLSRIVWSTALIGVSPWPNGTFSPSLPSACCFLRSFTGTCVMRAWCFLLDELDGIAEVAGDVVADVEVGAVVRRERERRLEHRRRRVRVAVVADHQVVLVRERAD